MTRYLKIFLSQPEMTIPTISECFEVTSNLLYLTLTAPFFNLHR
ncbi:hypothetical protein LEP1GSC076_0945 [Leptospira sp. Fiocruz LV4135]|nr:hypothetical protein LEP1GSC076_0945 [Leptospira sp. Fiocruz LV4135]